MLFSLLFFKVTHVVLCVTLFLQGYGEGSHYSEHEGLSSPFISTGVAGIFFSFLSKYFLTSGSDVVLKKKKKLDGNFQRYECIHLLLSDGGHVALSHSSF